MTTDDSDHPRSTVGHPIPLTLELWVRIGSVLCAIGGTIGSFVLADGIAIGLGLAAVGVTLSFCVFLHGRAWALAVLVASWIFAVSLVSSLVVWRGVATISLGANPATIEQSVDEAIRSAPGALLPISVFGESVADTLDYQIRERGGSASVVLNYRNWVWKENLRQYWLIAESIENEIALEAHVDPYWVEDARHKRREFAKHFSSKLSASN